MALRDQINEGIEKAPLDPVGKSHRLAGATIASNHWEPLVRMALDELTGDRLDGSWDDTRRRLQEALDQ